MCAEEEEEQAAKEKDIGMEGTLGVKISPSRGRSGPVEDLIRTHSNSHETRWNLPVSRHGIQVLKEQPRQVGLLNQSMLKIGEDLLLKSLEQMFILSCWCDQPTELHWVKPLNMVRPSSGTEHRCELPSDWGFTSEELGWPIDDLGLEKVP